MAGAVLGEVQVSLCVAGAVLGEVQVSLFVVGAVFGEVQVSLFVVGAVLGEVQVSLFVVGAVFGEIWKDRMSSKCCIFQYKMLVRSATSNLMLRGGLRTDGNGLGTVSDRDRIGRALEMTFQLFSANFCQMLDGHFAWQAQYLVSLEGEKNVNIPSEKYIYVHIYVCICVYTYLCKMDERRSYAGLS